MNMMRLADRIGEKLLQELFTHAKWAPGYKYRYHESPGTPDTWVRYKAVKIHWDGGIPYDIQLKVPRKGLLGRLGFGKWIILNLDNNELPWTDLTARVEEILVMSKNNYEVKIQDEYKRIRIAAGGVKKATKQEGQLSEIKSSGRELSQHDEAFKLVNTLK